MDSFDLYNELQDLTVILDAESFPELHNYLASIMDEENGVGEDPYEIANQILLCDHPADLPSVVKDTVIFLLRVYLNKKLFHDIVKYTRYRVLFKYTDTIY